MSENNPKIYNQFGYAVNNSIKATAAKRITEIAKDTDLLQVANKCRYVIAQYRTIEFCNKFAELLIYGNDVKKIKEECKKISISALEKITAPVLEKCVDDYLLHDITVFHGNLSKLLDEKENPNLANFIKNKKIDLQNFSEKQQILIALQAKINFNSCEILDKEIIEILSNSTLRQKVLIVLLFQEEMEYSTIRPILAEYTQKSDLKKAVEGIKVSAKSREILNSFLS
ncbi:MAG: hypothetical protein J6M05_03560 [Cardiobacteriaceae bacterium]|nr:hypothetical protein [Cardiobacteriaceae bacterium]